MLRVCRQLLFIAISLCVVGNRTVRAADKKGVSRPVVIPQSGVVQNPVHPTVKIDGVVAVVNVHKSIAVTTLRVKLQSAGRSAVACEVAVPLPEGAQPSACRLLVSDTGNGMELKYKSLSGQQAAAYLRQRVESTQTAGPLEFYGAPVAVVPNVAIPARGAVLEVTYRQALSGKGKHLAYSLPRSERLTYGVPWSINLSLKGRQPPSVLYSPTHDVNSRLQNDGTTQVTVSGNVLIDPGPFRLLWKTGGQGIDGLVVAFPPRAKEDGYFLWVIQAAERAGKSSPVKREVTLCIDRSASMTGKRLSQVRGIANTVLNNLNPTDTFNIISYNQNVDALSQTPLDNTATTVNSARTYLKNIRPSGGSNIYAALETALKQPSPKDRFPIVLFFTDGLPSGGKLNKEVDIGNLAIKRNLHRRRVYTFAMDVHVNSPLLQRIADETGGQSVFVLPKENVAQKVAPLLKRLQSPVLTGATLQIGDANGKSASGRFHAIMPARVPDLFAGDQIVVVGRYRGKQPVSLKLAGNYFGTRKTYRFKFDPKTASSSNTFIPRLWAARRVADLIDTIRQRGATYKPAYATPSKTTDAVVARCSREILDLTARHGIMTEYTAFLAGKYGYAFQAPAQYAKLLSNFDNRAVQSRAGIGGVNQEFNGNQLKGQTRADRRNRYWDAKMNRKDVVAVQQIGGAALFRHRDGWIDGRLLNGTKLPAPKTTIDFGSNAFWKLVDRLAADGRQGVLSLDGDLQLKDGRDSILIRRAKR